MQKRKLCVQSSLALGLQKKLLESSALQIEMTRFSGLSWGNPNPESKGTQVMWQYHQPAFAFFASYPGACLTVWVSHLGYAYPCWATALE